MPSISISTSAVLFLTLGSPIRLNSDKIMIIKYLDTKFMHRFQNLGDFVEFKLVFTEFQNDQF